MFNLMSPCSNCPFKIGIGSKFCLNPRRLKEIKTASAFQCHKTVDYNEDEPSSGNKPNQCAGLMAVLNRENEPNQIMQVAERMGVLDTNKLDPNNNAYKSWEDVIMAHKGLEPENE